LQRSYRYYTAQKKIAFDFGSAKPHGNVGNKRSVVDDPVAFPLMQDFFMRLSGLCEVRATETVRTMCGLRNSTGDTDRVYLPTWMSSRGCYAQYLDELGYEFKSYNDGNYEVIPRKSTGEEDEGEPLPYISLGCFYKTWKREFGHIKVSPPSEDICNKCLAFSNRHKYMAENSANSAADVALFLADPDDDDSIIDDGAEAEEEATDATKQCSSEEEPAAQEVSEKSTVEQLLEDEGAASTDPLTEAREQMIGRAYLHVEMARVQRLLYSTFVNKARCSVVSKVPHSESIHTYVVDYGQNMEVPVFNQEQPGMSYYLSPLSICNLGMVNQAFINNETGEVIIII
jgi:hypothetical protein